MTSPKVLAPADTMGAGLNGSRFLALPDELQERILMLAGAGGYGAYAACQELRAKFQRAIRSPSTACHYYLARYSRSRTAIVGAYVSVLNHLEGAFTEQDVLPLVTRLSSLGCGLSPPVLCLAARAGHLHVVRHVLQGLAPKLISADLAKSIVESAAHGHTEVVAALLAAPVPGSHAAADDSVALCAAARGPSDAAAVTITDMLLGAGAAVHSVGAARALVAAVETGKEALLRVLLGAGADAAAFDSAALQAACELNGSGASAMGDQGNGRRAASAGAGGAVNGAAADDGAPAGGEPTEERILQLITMLLDAGADPRACYSRPLYTVAERDALGPLRLLLARGGYSREAKSRALRAAARLGAAGSVELLLAAGADVHSTEAGGQSALDLALRHGRIGVARTLLGAGYDLSVAPRAVNALVAAAGATTSAGEVAAAAVAANAHTSPGAAGADGAVTAAAGLADGEQGAASASTAEGGVAPAECMAGANGNDNGDGTAAGGAAGSSASWEALQLLVDAGVDVRGLLGGEALVALACAGGSVRTLVAAGVDVRTYGSRALVEAAAVSRGLPGITTAVKELLAAGVTTGPEGRRAAGQALEAAITNSNVSAVQELLRSGNLDRGVISPRALRLARRLNMKEVLRFAAGEDTGAGAAGAAGGAGTSVGAGPSDPAAAARLGARAGGAGGIGTSSAVAGRCGSRRLGEFGDNDEDEDGEDGYSSGSGLRRRSYLSPSGSKRMYESLLRHQRLHTGLGLGLGRGLGERLGDEGLDRAERVRRWRRADAEALEARLRELRGRQARMRVLRRGLEAAVEAAGGVDADADAAAAAGGGPAGVPVGQQLGAAAGVAPAPVPARARAGAQRQKRARPRAAGVEAEYLDNELSSDGVATEDTEESDGAPPL